MKKLLSVLAMLLFGISVQAQSAEEFFHQSAKSYINADLQSAIQYALEGLSRYPNDRKLNELRKKLEEEQERQEQQQQQNQQQQDQQNQDQQQQNQEQQEQQNDQEQQEQEQQNQQQDGENEDQPTEPQEGEPLESKEISKEDAEKILKALAQKEKELLKEFKKQKSKDSATHDKDW